MGNINNIRNGNQELYFILLFACVGYFITVSKTALLLGVTSNRYQLPIYGIVVILVILVTTPLYAIYKAKQQGESGKGLTKILVFACVMAVIASNLKGSFWNDKVFFLYEREADIIAYAKENAHSNVVVFYNETSPLNVWRLSDELMEYDRIYLLSQGNPEPITDSVIKNSDKLVVYVADRDETGQYGEMIFEANPKVTEQKKIAQKEMWTLYEFH